MTKTATTNDFRHLPKTYSALVAMLPPRPIHDDLDLANATEVIDRLAGFALNRRPGRLPGGDSDLR